MRNTIRTLSAMILATCMAIHTYAYDGPIFTLSAPESSWQNYEFLMSGQDWQPLSGSQTGIDTDTYFVDVTSNDGKYDQIVFTDWRNHTTIDAESADSISFEPGCFGRIINGTGDFSITLAYPASEYQLTGILSGGNLTIYPEHDDMIIKCDNFETATYTHNGKTVELDNDYNYFVITHDDKAGKMDVKPSTIEILFE